MENELTIILNIKKNKFEFIINKYYNNLELLKNDIVDFIDIKTIKTCDFMETIIEIIDLTQELIGETTTVYENESNVYQLCYIDKENNPNIDESNINMICSYLINEKVYGNCAFINSKISENNTCIFDNSFIDDVVIYLYRKFVHIGIVIENNNHKEFEYLSHPLEYFNCSEKDYENYKFIEFYLLGFELCLFSQENTEKYINKEATRIVGTKKIYGDAILILKNVYEYHSINNILYDKILKICYGSLNNRKLLDSEYNDEQKINNLKVVNNKYCILEQRYKNIKNICNSCNIEFTNNILICTGCYRMRYHDEICQKNDWVNHKKECLYK